jgi:hypothetical protein
MKLRNHKEREADRRERKVLIIAYVCEPPASFELIAR